MSNPFVILGVIALMLLAGWLTTGELTPLLLIVTGLYLVLSVVGGYLVRSNQKSEENGNTDVSNKAKEGT